MLQAADLSLDDFEGLEGCNEILNVSRPDVVKSVHDAYYRAGADAVETNTFGTNWANLAEYDIVDRIRELARAGAALAKEVADGALVVLGGAFLITPGFVTDVVGVLCLLPPTRALLRRLLTGVVTARLLGPAAPGRTRRPEHPVIDGDVVDEDL
jgi:UPF0716 family protein affecting phage T7 exclusion